MGGYIGITDREWFDLNYSSRHKEVAFWRKKSPNEFNIRKGTPFFFLVKKGDFQKGNRLIEGMGIVSQTGSQPAGSLWERYGTKTGRPSLERLRETLGAPDDDYGHFRGYCILTDVEYIVSGGVDLEDLGIDFPREIETTKEISAEEAKRIIDELNKKGTLNKPKN